MCFDNSASYLVLLGPICYKYLTHLGLHEFVLMT